MQLGRSAVGTMGAGGKKNVDLWRPPEWQQQQTDTPVSASVMPNEYSTGQEMFRRGTAMTGRQAAPSFTTQRGQRQGFGGVRAAAIDDPGYGGGYQPGAMPEGSLPNVPTPGTGPGGTPLNNPTVGAQNPLGYQNTGQWWANGDNRNAMNAWLPYGQYEQNRYQYTQDFNEAQRRWDMENQWRQQSDAFNMGMAGRQQTMAEWQAQEAARQWASQFGWTQTTDEWNRDLSQQQLNATDWYNRAQIAARQTEAGNLDWYNRAQIESAAAQRASNEQIAAMQAYGRRQAPTARWVRNW